MTKKAINDIILGFVGAYVEFLEIDLHFATYVVQKAESIGDAFPNPIEMIKIFYNAIDDERDYTRIAQGYSNSLLPPYMMEDYANKLAPFTGMPELFYLVVYSFLTLNAAVYSIGCSTPRHTKNHRL